MYLILYFLGKDLYKWNSNLHIVERQYMHHFDYHKPTSLEDALHRASTAPGSSVYLAGGTDVLVLIKQGKIRPQQVIDVKGIPEINGIDISEDGCFIGALTTIRTLEKSQAVREELPILAQAASTLGSVQVRNRATIGGNLCNAAPSAETAPALLTLDAQVEIFGKSGRRILELTDFFRGPGLTVLAQGEILTRVKIPLFGTQRQGAVYYKLTTRRAMDIAFVGVAVLLELDGEDRITKARIALGAVAPTPVRVPTAEKTVEGTVLSDKIIEAAATQAAQACRPITDQRATDAYRTEMVHNLCKRGLETAYNNAQA
jgi:carbon-monoxide dehydrogenase medium subunit